MDIPSRPATGVLTELRDLEANGAASPLRLGVFTAYLLSGAIYGALGAPDLGRTVAATGRAARAVILAAYRDADPELAATVESMDEISDAVGRDGTPTAEFQELVAALIARERAGERIEVSWGPWTQFVVVGLLQMVHRNPAVELGPGRETVDQIARMIAANFSGEAADMLNSGFGAQFDVYADGSPVGDPLAGSACPACPRCGQPPAMALSPLQAICGNEACSALMWNPSRTAEENESVVTSYQLVRRPGEG